MFKKVIVHARRGIKLIILFMIAIFLIIGIVAFLFKPTYSVFINGQQVGYTSNKSELQRKINEFVDHGDGTNDNIAFVQVNELPEYKLCLLKRNIVTNDEEIYNEVTEQGTPYYRYYAILEDQQEKYYVSSFEEAENVINTLKEKNSENIDKISILEKYETGIKDMVSVEEVVSKLYVEKTKEVKVAKNTSSTASSGYVNTNTTTSSGKTALGISLIKPISGTITSRFGVSSSIRSSAHTGLDISAPTGTSIKAAAAGTVTFSDWKGSYGYMIVISHGNGIQTYYGHCSKLYASVGQTVAQGESIAAVGSTGNSTGPHLHLEVRINGTAYNPQNYVY